MQFIIGYKNLSTICSSFSFYKVSKTFPQTKHILILSSLFISSLGLLTDLLTEIACTCLFKSIKSINIHTYFLSHVKVKKILIQYGKYNGKMILIEKKSTEKKITLRERRFIQCQRH